MITNKMVGTEHGERLAKRVVGDDVSEVVQNRVKMRSDPLLRNTPGEVTSGK